MEPISMIVAALAMGAMAAVKKVGGKAAEDAYERLKKLITDRFKRGGAVAALAEDPSSETQRKALEEALAKADAAKDPEALNETLAKARELTQALEKAPRAALERALGARISELEAVNARFGDIDVAGPGTGVDVGKLKATGDAIFGNIKVRGPN